jgi:putative transposase
MYSYRSTAIRVLRLRVKDKHVPWLSELAREVNTVFNYCNELSGKVFERERRFLSGYDFWPLLKGVTRGECALHLPVQAVQEIAEEYARRRRQHRKIRLGHRRLAEEILILQGRGGCQQARRAVACDEGGL